MGRWNAKSHSKVTHARGHRNDVLGFSTGERLLSRPDDYEVAAVKFLPDGRLIAIATSCRDSVRVYDSQNGGRLVEFPIRVGSAFNQSLAWASDSKRLFTLSRDGDMISPTSTCSTFPPGPFSRNGPFRVTVATRHGASYWQATARSSQPPQVHQSHSGTLRRTSKSGLSSSTLIMSRPWLSLRTTTS